MPEFVIRHEQDGSMGSGLMGFLASRFGAENIDEMLESMPCSYGLLSLIRSGDLDSLREPEARAILEDVASQKATLAPTTLQKAGGDRMEKMIRKKVLTKRLAESIIEFLDQDMDRG